MVDAPVRAFLDSLLAGGACGRLMAARDWSGTPLGPIEAWPQSLRTATALLLRSPVPMVMLWGEAGIMIYNDAYSVFAGGRHPRLLGSRVREGWPEVAAFNDNVMRVCLAGGTLSYKDQELTLHRHGRPEQVWMDLDYSPVPDESGRAAGVLCVLAETTERVAAEARLRESEEQLRLATEAAEVGLWDVDVVNDTLFWPARVKAMFGISPAVAVSMADYYAGLHPEDREAVGAAYAAAADPARRAVYDVEYRTVGQEDGIVRWVAAKGRGLFEGGRCVRVIGTALDITARKRTEAALRESEARQRALIEGLPQLVWRAVGTGHWIWASPQWTAYTGQPEPESHGSGWLEPIHPDDRARARAAWSEAARRGVLDVEFRLRNAAKDRFCWFQARAVPLREVDGAIREWVGTSTDIDGLRRLQEQQRVMVAELQHRTRNLIAVVTGIAHETLARTGPGAAFAAQFDDRLAALSRVQGLLSRSAEAPITIEALVRMELGALGIGDGRASLEGPPVPLRHSTVQTLALAIHELATNARKHGALASARGALAIGWDTRADDAADGAVAGGIEGVRRWLVLDWVETGADPARGEAGRNGHRGYGRELIEEALPFALGARTRYALDVRGVRCRIELPLDRRGAGET